MQRSRSNPARLTLLLVPLLWLYGHAAQGDDSPAGSASTGILHLVNRDFVAGTLVASDDPAVLRWQSPFFTGPFEFSLNGVNAVHFALPPELPKPGGESCFELAGGDVLYGSLVSLTQDLAELDLPQFGRVHVQRSAIRRFYRCDSADLIYLGPNGLGGWKPSPAEGWREEAGQVLTDQNGAVLRGDFQLPAQSLIEVELSWEKTPDFVLALGVDDDASFAQAFRFEVWQTDLVVQRETPQEADVGPLGEVKSGAGRMHLQVYLDQPRGRCLVFSPLGERLADLQIAAAEPRTLPGIRLLNQRGGVRLDRLRISRWNGEPPRDVEARKSRVHRVDGSIVYGEVTEFDAAQKEYTLRTEQGDLRLAAAQIASVFFSAGGETDDRRCRAVYQDGTQLSGELTGISGDVLRMQSPGLVEPVELPVKRLRSLIVLKHDEALATAAGRAGVLELERVRLRGSLADGVADPEAGCLHWQPIGSATSSPLRLGVPGRIVYREPPAAPAQPSARAAPQGIIGGLFGVAVARNNNPRPARPKTTKKSLHLRTGDTIPCDVKQIDERGISFTTAVSDATFVAHDKVKAVELAQDDPNPLPLRKTKRERLLTLPRLQKDNPPTHLIRSKNGDYLRGRVVGLNDKTLQVEVRLEIRDVPRDRVARIIWLHPDELAAGAADNAVAAMANDSRVQAVRGDGTRLTFAATEMEDETLSGSSDVLGACRVALKEIDQLLIGTAIEQAAAQLAYQQFKLHNAAEPKEAQEGGSPGVESALVGKPAPDFELEYLAGGKFHLADARGKVVVLDFWATWCGPCLQAMPQVARVAHEFADRGVQVLAVNLEETPQPVKSMLERHKLDLTVLLDRDGAVAGKYAVTSIPQTIVIDREGKVVRHFIGGSPRLGEELSAALNELLTEKSVNSKSVETPGIDTTSGKKSAESPASD